MGNDKNYGEDIKGFVNRLYLENSRVLFGFMQELSDCCTNLVEPITDSWKYEGYAGAGSLEVREERLGKLKENVKTLIDQCYDGNNLLLQNPLSSYLKFYKEVFTDDSEYAKIAEMLNYFNILRFLTEPEYREKRHKDFNSLPYIFEDMCLSIRNMTAAKSAYLVYKKEGESSQLISRSGYVLKEGEEAYPIESEGDKFSPLYIGAIEFDLLIKSYYSNEMSREEDEVNIIVDGLAEIKKKKPNEHTFLLFDFPFREGEADEKNSELKKKNDERHFYVILELNEEVLPTKESDIMREIRAAIRVLFLRNRLWEAVRKCYSGVINFRFYCNYIRSVINKDDVNEDDVRILHLTDLHLDDNESWAIGSIKLNTLVQRLNEFKNEIDLVAVTGDIVNASDNAAEAQRKYKRAANLLFEIAKGLWGKKYGNDIILPHDWKRRIIVTTGNHDYAAMNDVRVQTESRKITMGLPAAQSGGTMQKYTYFIEFLSYFLDAPTQKLLKHDLNEVREYDNLNLIVCNLNSCSKANALQNNKVSFDVKKVKLVIEDSNWKEKKYKRYRHFIFAHHSPQYFYDIDYFEDKYKLWDLEENFKELYWSFLYELGSLLIREHIIDEKVVSDFNVRRHVLEKKGASGKAFKELWQNWNVNKAAQLFNGEIFRDMEMLNKIISKDDNLPDEYKEKFITEARNLFVTMYNDAEHFNKVYVDLCINVDNVAVCAGHVHKARQGEHPLSFIGHRLYDFDKGVNAITYELIVCKNGEIQRDIHSFIDNSWRCESEGEAQKAFLKAKLKI